MTCPLACNDGRVVIRTPEAPGGLMSVPCPVCVPFPDGPTMRERYEALKPAETFAEWCAAIDRATGERCDD